PISYSGQRQANNVEMEWYYKGDQYDSEYLASEAKASLHLGDFDYMLSTQKTPRPTGGVDFPFEHLASVVRFFLRTPNTVTGVYHFNRIWVVAPKPIFYTQATVDMSNCTEQPIVAEKHLTRTGEPSKALCLSLGSDDEDDDVPPYFVMNYPTEKYSRYIVAYMMLNPVNLGAKDYTVTSGDFTKNFPPVLEDTDEIHLYLEGVKVKDEYGVDVNEPAIFKTAPLEHKNFKAGYVYQWTDNSLKVADPILLEPIEIEDWNALDIDNTVNGNGTSLW
ncbi:MAG: hypothetical protein KBT06_03615, partial [Prevotellaceae bacterium]|nr:hypothetical protein [Candidatus Colivivens equi]